MFGQHDPVRPEFCAITDSTPRPAREPSRPEDLRRTDFLGWMFDHTSSLICGRSTDDTIFYVNEAFCSFFGVAPDVLMGTKWLPPIIRPDKSVLSRFSSANQGAITCMRLVEDNQKQIVPLLVEYFGMFTDNGQLRGFCSIARRPTQEHNRLGSVHQNERFNNFRIAQKEQAIRSLALCVAEAQERERRKIALDLHDDVGQMLYLLRMKIDGLREGSDSPGVLDESISILDQVITKTRTMTSDIGSYILRDFGLSKAIQAIAEDIGRQHHVEFQVDIDTLPDTIPNAIQSITYRIIRELLFNIVKHAQASFATIHVQGGAGFVKVEIADNGTQSNPMVDIKHFGFGLKSVKEQIQLIGGVFLIKRSRPLGGMHVQFILPTTASPAE